MNLILRFLKPHWKLCAVTIILLIVDVAGALFIPTLVAEMLNDGTSGSPPRWARICGRPSTPRA